MCDVCVYVMTMTKMFLTAIDIVSFRPENILMSSNYELKLADFGLGNSVEDENDLLETECGTRSYMAPGKCGFHA